MSKSVLALLLCLACFVPSRLLADKIPADLTLTAHSSAVLDLAFSPDAKRLASVGDDGALLVFDLVGKKQLFKVPDAHSNTNQIRFTPDGKTVVTLGSDRNLIVIDAMTGKPRQPIAIANLTGGPTAFDLSPDGKTIAVVGRASLRLIDLATGAAKASYEVHKSYGVTAVAFSADGKTIATAGSDNTALIVDAGSGKVLHTFKLSLNGVALAFSRDGKTLFTSATDRVVQSIDIASGAQTRIDDHSNPTLTLSASADGKSLILGGPGHGPWVVALPPGKLKEPTYDCDAWIKSAAISADGKWLAGGGNDGGVYLWKVAN